MVEYHTKSLAKNTISYHTISLPALDLTVSALLSPRELGRLVLRKFRKDFTNIIRRQEDLLRKKVSKPT